MRNEILPPSGLIFDCSNRSLAPSHDCATELWKYAHKRNEKLNLGGREPSP